MTSEFDTSAEILSESFYFCINQNFAHLCQVFEALGLTFTEEYGRPVFGQRLCPLQSLYLQRTTQGYEISDVIIIAWRGNRSQELCSSGRINKTLCIVLGIYIYCIV
jgi:hypothetical protein